MKIRKLLAVAVSAVLAVSALATAASAASYNAYFAFQTAPYSFRNTWNDTSYGKATDYYNNVIVWGAAATDPDTFGDDYADYFDYDVEGYLLPATFTDAVLNGDGTYTIGVSGFDWALDKATSLNLLQISTDIPLGTEVTFSDVKMIVDGTAIPVEAVGEESGDYIVMNLINIWNTEVAAYTGAYPTSTLEIEFTISGLGTASVGDTDTATDGSSKDSADTGVEGVAAIAGLALVATGTIIVAKKRK